MLTSFNYSKKMSLQEMARDDCGGSVSSSGEYYYTGYPSCVALEKCGEPSPLYGVALDGFPIYGPITEAGVQVTGIDLDDCGGLVDSQGRYRYHVTVDPPHFPACLRGQIRKDVGRPAEDFTCSCPFREPSSAGLEPICDFSGDVSVGAECTSMSMENTTHSTRKWIEIGLEVELAGCCPPQQDCTAIPYCQDRDSCVYETRKVGVWANVLKVQSCWEACYDACMMIGGCNCKRKCKRECTGRNGASDFRLKKRGVSGRKNECNKKRN